MSALIRLLVALVLVVLAPCSVAAQTSVLAGRVLDATSGRPIATAEVLVEGSSIRAVTQQDGSYLLDGVAGGPQRVTVRRIGYEEATAEVTVAPGGATELDFALHADPLRLDELVVTGMPLPRGTSRRAIGNAVTTVPVADILQDAPASTFQEVLSGRTPGIRFARLSGNLGTGSPFWLRGIGTFDLARSQPLVYVDGVRVNSDFAAGPLLHDSRAVHLLDDFGLEEIETVEIIQGAAAGSLYGSDAASGVIHILTPRGQIGPPQFTATIRRGVNYLADPAGRIGTQYYCPDQPFPMTTIEGTCSQESDLRTYNMYEEANDYIRRGYFPWPTEELFTDGTTESFALSVRGGTPAVRYFLSAAYDDEHGMLEQNRDRTARFRGNVDVTLNERFALDVSAGLVDGRTSFVPTRSGGYWLGLVASNGYYLYDVTPFGGPGNCTGSGCGPNPRTGGFYRRLPSDVAQLDFTREYTRFTGSTAVSFTSPTLEIGSATAALRSRALLGLDKGWDVNRNLFPRDDRIPPNDLEDFCALLSPCTPPAWDAAYSETVLGTLRYERPISTSTTAEVGVTLDVRFPSFATATSVGAQHVVQDHDFFASVVEGLPSSSSEALDEVPQESITTLRDAIEARSIGLYVQEEVAFRDRVFLTGALRLDESSSFGVDVSPRLYPKLAAAWVVSEERFWGVDAIESLRIRGAWGKAGRPPAPLQGHTTFVRLTGVGGGVAVQPSAIGNPEIEPEVATELEMGFDVSAFDGRVAASFTRHSRRNEGAILDVAVASSLGLPGPMPANVGRIDTWGWEAQLHTRLYETATLSFALDLYADHVDNEIVALGDFAGTPSIAIGLPYPNQVNDDLVLSATFDPAGTVITRFGQRVSGICDEGLSLAPDPSAPDAAKYGRVKGGVGVPCQTIPDRNVVMGRAFATHTFGIAPRIALFGNRLQLFALAEGQYGRLREANDREESHAQRNSKAARLENDPAWVYGFNVGDDAKLSLYDADFWKLREVGARYTLPANVTRAVGADRASLSVSARNLWTIWRAQSEIYGLAVSDPEFGSATFDGDANQYEMPPLTNISMTLRVTF